MQHETKEKFHDILKKKMDLLVHLVYRLSRKFPKEEIYGVTSQIRRAVLSVILNYVEGYARQREKVNRNFLEISYGSLKETKYLLYFAFTEKYINEKEYKESLTLAEEIGAMLWSLIK